MSIIGLVVCLGCAFWCYSLATKNGRNNIIAAILGLLFGIFAVIGYYIAGKKN